MESTGLTNDLKTENYVHCSICANYRNINSFPHRKSPAHQKKLAAKLKRIIFYLSQAKKKPTIIHDVHWPGKDSKHFCHFCAVEYPEHYTDDEFVVETLGSLYHYSSYQHSVLVKAFLKQNFRDDKPGNFLLESEELDKYLSKVFEEKEKYAKKMDILHQLSVKQIKDVERRRVEMFESHLLQNQTSVEKLRETEQKISDNMASHSMVHSHDSNKLPPWLDDIPADFNADNIRPVIGPTIDVMLKHVASQKKKGLANKRVGANFQHHAASSTGWLPSFQGIWSTQNRKRSKNQFLKRNSKKKKESFGNQ